MAVAAHLSWTKVRSSRCFSCQVSTGLRMSSSTIDYILPFLTYWFRPMGVCCRDKIHFSEQENTRNGFSLRSASLLFPHFFRSSQKHNQHTHIKRPQEDLKNRSAWTQAQIWSRKICLDFLPQKTWYGINPSLRNRPAIVGGRLIWSSRYNAPYRADHTRL